MAALQKGFTLIELVMVIIILSALGIMTSSYIGTGVDIYTGISDRDKSLNSVRFVMERLRREASNALPNSAYVTDKKVLADGTVIYCCLTFTPIETSTLYRDFPISPISPVSGSTGTIEPITRDDLDLTETKAVVYLLTAAKGLSNSSIKEIKVINDKDTLTFDDSLGFPLGSPAKRVYFIKDDIRYCFNDAKELYRSVIVNNTVATTALMAQGISGSFAVDDVSLQRNSLVKATFNLDFDGQKVPVEQTLHINNVP